ncbi:MAG: ROK family protein [Bacteroidota bacterium]|nr:ROK family protein [Bacteroidota bacterium]
MDSRKGAVVGIDLGGTKLSGALFSKEGEIIHKTELLLEDKGGTEVGSMLVKMLLDFVDYAEASLYRIDSVGICVPGISNHNNQSVWAPNIRGWEAYPLFREVREGLNNPSVPVSIESDRNCYILGEMWKGNARSCNNAIFMAVGTGIGIGIVSNGQIINGASGIAGAIGWLALNRPYKPEYESCGQFEYYASGSGIARNAERLLMKDLKSKHLVEGMITARDVFAAYDKNDPVATRVIEQCIEYWGMTVANLVSIFNPEKIIFGGGIFGPALQFLPCIYKEVQKWAQPISIQQVKLEASALKGDAGLIGAGYLAIRNKFML